jgi:hypothetical protein
MVFTILRNHLSREYSLGKNSLIGKGFRTIVSENRVGRSLNVASIEVVMRTWPSSIRQGRENERVPTRRVTVMEEHHIQRRRRT